VPNAARPATWAASGPAVTFFTYRRDGELLAVGALKQLDGSHAEFTPARSLYARAGFTPCGPFGDYPPGRGNTFMTLAL
jgi:hypothetical protein